jgi:hypothetical protein
MTETNRLAPINDLSTLKIKKIKINYLKCLIQIANKCILTMFFVYT